MNNNSPDFQAPLTPVTPPTGDPLPNGKPIIPEPTNKQKMPIYTPPPIDSHDGITSIKPPKNSAVRELFSTIGILVTALVVALLMIGFVFRSYQVDGPSMENTLQNSDKLIIWKVPRTIASITNHPYIPNRGDVIVFTESGLSQFGQTDSKQLIKRVIGLPGDRVVVSNGAYTIYNKQNPKGFNPDKTLPYGKNIPATSGDIDVTLGANQLFVSGDNRPDSLDSRAFGPITADQIVGKLVLRVYPLNKAQAF
jgi:signal peptidase I